MTRKEKAIELHNKGFNCAQAVACAFADETGIPEETLFAACEGLDLAWVAWQQPAEQYPVLLCLQD